jgi:hypothetical protein
MRWLLVLCTCYRRKSAAMHFRRPLSYRTPLGFDPSCTQLFCAGVIEHGVSDGCLLRHVLSPASSRCPLFSKWNPPVASGRRYVSYSNPFSEGMPGAQALLIVHVRAVEETFFCHAPGNLLLLQKPLMSNGTLRNRSTEGKRVILQAAVVFTSPAKN